MHELRRMEKPVVFDADSLHLVKNNLDLLRGWRNAFLTPNRNEFQRLASAFDIEVDPKEPTKQLQQVPQHCLSAERGTLTQTQLKRGMATLRRTIHFRGLTLRAGGEPLICEVHGDGSSACTMGVHDTAESSAYPD